MIKKLAALALLVSFFSPVAYAKSIGGFTFTEIRGAEGKTEGCGRGSDGNIHCVKQSWCVPFTNICSWKYVDSGTGKSTNLRTKTNDDGSFKVVDVGSKKPPKDAEELRLERDAATLGITPAELKKIEQEDNDFARLVREIQVKKAEQEKKRKLEEQGSGGGSQGGGGSVGGSGGGGSVGGSGGGGSAGGSGGGGSAGGSGGGGSAGGSGGGGSAGGSGGGGSAGGSGGGGSSEPVPDPESKVKYWAAGPVGNIKYGGTAAEACSGSPPSGYGKLELRGNSCIYSYGEGQSKNAYSVTLYPVEEKVKDFDKKRCSAGANHLRTNSGGGTFSVLCTVKGADTSSSFGGSVLSTGGSNSSGPSSSFSGSASSSSSSGSGGGKGPNTGGSLPTGSSVGQGDGKGGQGDGKGGQGDGKGGQSDGKGGQSDGKGGQGDGSGDSKGDGNGNGSGKGQGDSKGDDKDTKPDKDEEQDLSGIEKLILGVIDSLEKLNENLSKKLDGIREDLECIKSGDCKKEDGDKGKQDGKDKEKDGDSGKDDESAGGDGEGDFSIPTSEGGVTYSPDGSFGSGSGGGVCPRPLTSTFLGQQIEVSYQPLCDLASSVRFLIVGFAYLAAAYIMFGRKD